MIKPVCIPLLLLFCSGCSINQNLNQSGLSLARTCTALIDETEHAIATAQVADSQAARITGLPYLRVNRLLSSFRYEVTGEAFDSWIDRLQELAINGWNVELMNLPEQARQNLVRLAGAAFPENPKLMDALRSCSTKLRQIGLDEAAERQVLREKARVPAEYKTWQQIAGFYPLSAIAFRMGIARWHHKTRKTFSIPLDKLPVTGELLRYTPNSPKSLLSSSEVAAIIKRSSGNPLAIPLPNLEEQQSLFDRFAPVFEIDTASGDDQIGIPVLKGDQAAVIDTEKPMVYKQLSHARIGKQILLQLNYMAWFPSRPKQSAWDLVGGHLDGLIWRVTLLPDGKPWLFDSIHVCGCYHLFFPTQYARISGPSALWNEPDFMPQPELTFDENKRTVLRVASATHYIDRVYSTSLSSAARDRLYQWDDVDSLRSLILPSGQRRSLFGQDALVAGSERNERFLFWPMGIPSPGAMRQWGHHATAFVGRRHFDDPWLFARSFSIRPPLASIYPKAWKKP